MPNYGVSLAERIANEIWGIAPVKTDLSVVSLGLERTLPESSIVARRARS